MYIEQMNTASMEMVWKSIRMRGEGYQTKVNYLGGEDTEGSKLYIK